MGLDSILHEPGDGAVVDAVVYCSFVAAGRGCYNVSAWFFPGTADEWGEKIASLESCDNCNGICFLSTLTCRDLALCYVTCEIPHKHSIRQRSYQVRNSVLSFQLRSFCF